MVQQIISKIKLATNKTAARYRCCQFIQKVNKIHGSTV